MSLVVYFSAIECVLFQYYRTCSLLVYRDFFHDDELGVRAIFMDVCVRERERERVCVCVYICVRESE